MSIQNLHRSFGHHAAISTTGSFTILWIAAVSALLTLNGCEIFAFVANAIFQNKIKAVHELTDRPTLILVDDPRSIFEDLKLPDYIANETAYELIDKRVLSQANAVPIEGLYPLKTKLGRNYNRTPIDHIGKSLEAQQVVHIFVQSVSLGDTPGLLRPAASVRVKVIDAITGKRLLPAPDPNNPLPPSQSYHLVDVTMPYHSGNADDPNVIRQARQQLAKRVARDVSRLFFDHWPRQPGEPFDR